MRYSIAACESEEGPKVAVIGLLDGANLAEACVSRCREILGCSPSEVSSVARLHQHVGHESRVASVAVGPRMDAHQWVMQADRDLVEGIGIGLQPCLGIGECMVDAFGQSRDFPAEVALGLAKVAGPFPNTLEHASMRFSAKNVAMRAT